MQQEAGGLRPEFDLVAVTLAAMAAVAAPGYVDGEGESATAGRAVAHGTVAVPLIATTTLRLKAE
jgi:hypothetical protein